MKGGEGKSLGRGKGVVRLGCEGCTPQVGFGSMKGTSGCWG